MLVVTSEGDLFETIVKVPESTSTKILMFSVLESRRRGGERLGDPAGAVLGHRRRAVSGGAGHRRGQHRHARVPARVLVRLRQVRRPRDQQIPAGDPDRSFGQHRPRELQHEPAQVPGAAGVRRPGIPGPRQPLRRQRAGDLRRQRARQDLPAGGGERVPGVLGEGPLQRRRGVTPGRDAGRHAGREERRRAVGADGRRAEEPGACGQRNAGHRQHKRAQAARRRGEDAGDRGDGRRLRQRDQRHAGPHLPRS